MSQSGGFAMPSAPATAAGGPGMASDLLPTSTVEISVRCTDLADKDLLSKSDPICVMFMQRQGKWFEIGRTEMIKDTLNPSWEKKFIVNYSFEERQVVKFEIYDWDVESKILSHHDFLGRTETTLGSIVSSSEYVAVLRDVNKSGSKIYVFAEELKTSKEVIRMQLRAEKLDKKDFFGKSDPFFVLSKATGQKFSVVKRSEVIMKNLSPTWAPFEISAKLLCNGDHTRPLKFDVYDWDSDGTHDYIGSFTTTLEKLEMSAVEQTGFPCINDEKKRKKGNKYKDSGVVFIKSCQIETQPTFVEYLQGGVSMNFSVAVDFTASNGDPRQPQSLHFYDPTRGGENQYTTAIRSVGEIIQDYDTDKQFPALGFGAKIPPSGQVSHEFFLNLKQDSPYCAGVDGLLQAYWNAIQQVRLYGPTNFSPVINHVANFARAYQQSGDQYFVLLIITDGIITDLDQTKLSIVNACELPMSIIIVGVGNEDFSAMEELDGDQKKLSAHGRIASRDIVQFVELRKFLQGNYWSKELLAKEVLAEIPQQFVGWMKAHGINPKNVPGKH